MSEHSLPVRVVGNLVALVALFLGLALAGDYFAHLLGFETTAWFCAVLSPVADGIRGIGILLTCIGLITYTASMFRSEKALGLAVGGFLLAFVPHLLAHYLNVSCAAAT